MLILLLRLASLEILSVRMCMHMLMSVLASHSVAESLFAMLVSHHYFISIFLSFFGEIITTNATQMTATSCWPTMQQAPKSSSSSSSSTAVPAVMNYLANDVEMVHSRRNLAGSDNKIEGAKWNPSYTEIYDAREHEIKLHRFGFELRKHNVPHRKIDFFDQDDVVEKYYPLCEKLVEEILQEGEENIDGFKVNKKKKPKLIVKAFDHNVRSSKSSQRSLKNSIGAVVQTPVAVVHNDYTRVSSLRRIQNLALPPKKNDTFRRSLSDPDSSLLDPNMIEEVSNGKKRFAFINVWRNIRDEPITQFPLALVDTSTVTYDDFRTFQIHYEDRIGENYFVCSPDNNSSEQNNRKHGWYYYPSMDIDEALLIKQWDSKGGIAKGLKSDKDRVSTFAVHSAFLNPCCVDEKVDRESIEVRCVIIWENDI